MLSIAICDDEEYFRITEKQLILKYMAGKNCECMIDMYESGKELLNLREELNQYHIIFLDVNMEEIDGIETAKEIRKISKDVFIVFTSNIFAILGLRSLYFALNHVMGYFYYLKYALAGILSFIGFKMCFNEFCKEMGYSMYISNFVSLGIILGLITISIIASVWLQKKNSKKI